MGIYTMAKCQPFWKVNASRQVHQDDLTHCTWLVHAILYKHRSERTMLNKTDRTAGHRHGSRSLDGMTETHFGNTIEKDVVAPLG